MTVSVRTFVRSDWLIASGSALLFGAAAVTRFAHLGKRNVAIIPADVLSTANFGVGD
jgi:hypothetical protein